MKKILSFLMVFVLFILVGCTTAQNKLPNLKDTDKVEMTAEEKLKFMQTVVASTNEVSDNFKLDTFLDLEFALTNEMSLTLDGMSMENDVTVTFKADFDMTNYIEVGASAADTYVYSKFNKFEFDMLNDTYTSTSFGGEANVVDEKTTASASLSNTFFLARSDFAYYQVNGRFDAEFKQGKKVVEGSLQSKTYSNVQEKVLDGRITQDMYLELIASILELQQNLMIDVHTEMTLEARTEMLAMLDTHVSIYSSGEVHTIQFLITQDKVADLIDELFDAMLSELSSLADLETINSVKDSVKAAFKGFNFDFRIILDGPLEGSKTLSKIELMISGIFSGFTMDLTKVEGSEFPLMMKMTVKLNKLGFTLDFNADAITLPSDAELELFELVEHTTFEGLLDGLL